MQTFTYTVTAIDAAKPEGLATKPAYNHDGTSTLYWNRICGDDRVPPASRRYDLLNAVGEDQRAEEQRRITIAVALTPPADRDAEFNDWYEQEHVKLLSKNPHWLRSRRLRLSGGTGPAYMALHDYSSLEESVKATDEFRAAVNTPWCKEMVLACRSTGELGYERNVWLHHSVHPAFIVVKANAEGETYFLEEDVEMASQHWIGSKSTKYPASALRFRLVKAEHIAALSHFNPIPAIEIQINVDKVCRLHTSDGRSRIVLPGEMVRYEDVNGTGHCIEALQAGDRQVIVITP